MHAALRLHGELRPLRDPTLIAAFAGWTDVGGSAVATIQHLVEQWNATELADIDPEPFYDFTVQRPRVRLQDGERVLDWPSNRFYVARPEGADRDFVLLAGVEPSLRWQTFTDVIADLMREVGASTSVMLNAHPGSVPHTRPTTVNLSASHPDFEQIFGLQSPASRYQGPVGIVSVLNLHHRSQEWRNALLSAVVPHYLTLGPNPNVAIALVQLLDRAFHTSTSIEPLNERAREYEEQVREMMERSSEAADYVRQLEEQYDSSQSPLPDPGEGGPAQDTELPSSEDLIGDLERFLRERREGDA